jgi:hypothetical protein
VPTIRLHHPSTSRRRRAPFGRIAFLVLVCVTGATAEPPLPPLSGSDFVAQRAFVGDLRLGIEPSPRAH